MRGLAVTGRLLILVVVSVVLWREGAAQLMPSNVSEIVILPQNSTTLEGNTLILTCVGYGMPAPEVTWMRDGETLTNDTRYTIYSAELEVGGLPFTQSTLEICSLELEDADTYACSATNTDGTDTRSFEVAVEPREKVEIVVQPASSEFDEGQTAILTCVGYGTPDNPNITWSRNGMPITAENDVRIYQEVLVEGGVEFVMSNLEICSISVAQGGVYSCSATLQSGLNATSSDFFVNVTGDPPEIVIAPTNSEVTGGNTVIFTCVALGVPPPEISWTANGEMLSNSTNSRVSVYSEMVDVGGVQFVSSMLEICSVELSDRGQYSCIARDDMDRYETVYFNVSVVILEPAEIVIAPQNSSISVGNTVLFSCVALGNPPPNITWVRHDGTVVSNDSRVSIYDTAVTELGRVFIHSILEICSVELEDDGYYTCVAANSGGTSNSSFVVDVTEEGTPEIAIAPSDTTLFQGNTGLFTCVAFGDIPPFIRWTRNGYRINNGTDGRITVYTDTIEEGGRLFMRSILELCSAEESDEGEYSCVATAQSDPSRNSTAYFDVDVITPEDEVKIVIAPQSTVVNENSTVLLTCVTFGLPLPTTITWSVRHRDRNTTYELENTTGVTVYYEEVEQGGAVFLQSILELCGIGLEQSGYYSCSAESSAGNDSASFELMVTPIGPPEIVIAPPDTTVTEGDTVLFTCVALGNPMPMLSFYRNAEPIDNGTDDGRVTVYRQIVTQNEVEFVMVILEICSTEFEDAGQYSCQANNTSGYDMAGFNVTVEPPFESPQIVIAPPDTEADINSTILFTCVASGYPLPYISWYRGSSMLSNDSRVTIFSEVITVNGTRFNRSILQLCGVEPSDQQRYKCVAINQVNSSQSEFSLNVLQPPTIAIKPADTTAPYGATVLFTCAAFGNEDENPTISWLKNSQPVISDDVRSRVYQQVITEGGVNFTRSILELCSVTFDDDGVYSCVATDSVGSVSADFSVSIYTAVDVVMISNSTEIYAGSSGIFSCAATGTPTPGNLTWLVGGQELVASDRIKIISEQEVVNNITFVKSILEICDIEEGDMDEYTCVAEVPRRNATASFQLTVLTMSPNITIPPANATIVTGTSIELECQVVGAPPPTITWTVGDDPVPDSANVSSTQMGPKTVISNIQLGPVTASAVYTCTANNLYGNDSASAYITVQFPIAVMTSPSDTTVLVGNMATFMCEFSGYPVPTSIEWFKEGDDGPLTDARFNITSTDLSSQLSFVTELEDHNTLYYCRAMQTLVTGDTNDTTRMATLTVNSAPVLSNNYTNNMMIGVLNGTLILYFTISDAQPEVTQSGVVWTFEPMTIGEAAGQDADVINGDSTSDRYTFTYTSTQVRLRIHPVELGDEGTYRVNVSNIVGYDTDFVFVNVVIGARITDPPNDTIVHVGLNATFTCVVTSEPVHEVLWLFNNVMISNGGRYIIMDIDDTTSVLVIINVVPDDDGIYTCDVNNTHGMDMDDARLRVISTPEVMAVTQSPVITLSGAGVSITLEFTVVNDIPTVELESSDWRVTNEHGPHTIASEDSRFTFSNDFKSLTINPVHPADEGVYTLTAVNEAGNDSASITVDVQFVPTITMPPQYRNTYIGSDSIFMCSAEGEPDPQLSWTFNGQTLSTNDKYTVAADGSMLTVHEVALSDEGNYVCVATNTHANATASAFLLPISTPIVTTATPNRVDLLDSSVTLTFSVTDDYPQVVPDGVQWFFMADMITSDSDSSGSASGAVEIDSSGDIGSRLEDGTFSADRLSLTIPSLLYDNEGTYTVMVENIAGVDYAQIRLDVQADPRVAISPSGTTREHEEGSVTFTCSVLAEPDAEVMWLFGDTNITDGGRYTLSMAQGSQYYEMTYMLMISDLMTSDAGDYRCRAENIHGDVTSEIVTLEVLVEPEISVPVDSYRFIAGQENVAIIFVSSNREFPSLYPSNVTMRFQMAGSENITDVEDGVYRQLSDNRLILTFTPVRPEHEGQYWIVAVNDAGTTTSSRISVEVFINPTIQRGAGDAVVAREAGQTVTFTCTATGEPRPSITWNKDGGFLVTTIARFDLSDANSDEVFGTYCNNSLCTSVTSTLVLSGLTVRDTGFYSCKASIGLDLPAAQDAVIDTPYNLTVTEVFVDRCAINPCQNGGTCNSFEDTYTCRCVVNFVGVNCSEMVEVVSPPDIIAPPLTVFVDIFDPAMFSCQVTGNPKPTIEWFRDGELLKDETREELVIRQVELNDRAEYFCIARNTEGIVQSIVVVLNIDDIAQFVLIIRLGRISRKRATISEDVEMLIAMLNEQLTGTMIGNATVYSVALQDGVDISTITDEVPLIFTFFSDEEEDGGGDGGEGPVVEATFDIEEIERVVEQDVMLAAVDLGLNVTVQSFFRFDGCPSETTEIPPDSLSSAFNISLPWSETDIGGIRTLPCLCEAFDLQRVSTRTCGGNFSVGAIWDAAETVQCEFTDITRQLCSSPALSAIESLVGGGATLEVEEIAVATELLEGMVNTSSGNVAESDSIFNAIEDILRATSAELTAGQTEFNTSGRILSSLERLSDAYPTTTVDPTMVSRESFGFLLHNIRDTAANSVATFSAVLGPSNAITDDGLFLISREGAAARMVVNIGSATGIVFAVYTSQELFSRRAEYIETNNRTSFILGSVVVSAHFSGQFSRTTLASPVVITLMKNSEAVANGTKTECSFWDQSLDSGYGAWSTDGCRLVSESRNEAVCECDHLTQFALLVDVTPVREEEEDDDSINEGSYVGGLVCIVFLVIILITYLGSSDLRSTTLGVSLINTCVCLICLFISYLVSYYTTESETACTVFSAVFHYVFLVTSISFGLFAHLKTWQPERLKVIVLIALALQLTIPAVIVVIAAAVDPDNYSNDEFCRPQQEPYWYGLLLLAGIIHLIAWSILLSALCAVRVRHEKINRSSWFLEWMGIAVTFLLFDIAWGFGLPSTNSLGLGATRLVFQIVFTVGSAVLGLIMFVFFVLLMREARETWTGWFNSLIPGRTGRFYTDHTNDVEENLYVSGGGLGMSEMSAKAPLDEADERAAKRESGAEAMKESGDDPEHIVNLVAVDEEEVEQAEGGSGEDTTSEVMKVDFGMFEDDDSKKDTKL